MDIEQGGHDKDMDIFQDCNTKTDRTITEPIPIVKKVAHGLTHVFY